jgi:hypothetical protein
VAFAINIATTAGSFVLPAAIRDPWPYSPGALLVLASLALLPALMMWQITSRGWPQSRRALGFAVAFVVCLSALAVGCGGGGSTGGGGNAGTPAGTYTLTITGKSAQGTTRTLNVTLTVN